MKKKDIKDISVAKLAELLCNAMENGISPDTPVKITLSEPFAGPRAWTTISEAMIGFDWETGDFRIDPKEPLIRKDTL